MNSLTRIKSKYFNYTWVIRDYVVIFGKEGKISSHIVNPGFDDKTRLQLHFTKNSDDSSYVKLSLQLHDLKGGGDEEFSYKISVIKDDEVVYTRIDFVHYLTDEIFNMLRTDVNKFTSSTGSLKIHFELTYATGSPEHFLKDESDDTNEVLMPKFNFDWIFLGKELSDVNLRAKCGKEIPAHRVVLAGASPVFKAMFSHDMVENKSQLVDMADVNYEAAVEMLRYMYTGSVKTQACSLTAEILAAADKYQLEELKNKCEKILCSNVSTENAIEILKVADKYNVSCLKKKVVDFVRHKITESSDSDKAGTMILGVAQFLSE
ncbi:speckle-type POZ protein-like [Trichogramma pretiosum]|uniref:speckle-type POZ protein-like n=1 Tax=Trichogramma pretiosum TaxID=7493 RepID=UPI0006C94DA0|nr:speckle-type POZ protein-like [Trichogramma pretiosum]